MPVITERRKDGTVEDRLRLLERETHGTIVDTVLRHLNRIRVHEPEAAARREATHPAPYDDPNNADA